MLNGIHRGPVQTDEHFLTVASYVQRNALRAKLVERAEEWQWSSVYRSARHDAKLADFLSPWPMKRPQNWIERINEPDKASELDDLRSTAQRGRPFVAMATVHFAAVTAALLAGWMAVRAKA